MEYGFKCLRIPHHVDDLRNLDEDMLLEIYDIAVHYTDETLIASCEEAMQTYHYCDVCGAHSSIDEPCELH